MGRHGGWPGGRRSEGKLGQEPLLWSLSCGFHKKERVRQSKQAEQGQDWIVSVIPVALGHRGDPWLSGALALR